MTATITAEQLTQALDVLSSLPEILASLQKQAEQSTQNKDVPDKPIKPEFMTPRELAQQLGVSPQTLASWRFYGKGPKFTRMERLIRYRLSDVDEWIASQNR